jgi:lipooligosaccharide transport system permease protein
MLKWIWLIIGIAIANPVLYLVSIGLGVGAYIDKNTGGMGVDGVSYITFLAPALLATAAIQGAGWGWLVYNKATKGLEYITTAN